MCRFTCVPKQVAHGRQVLRPMVRQRHHGVFCWLRVGQAVSQARAPIPGVARLLPRHLAEWHRRRLLTAAYWHGRVLLWGGADHVMAALPPPDDGVCDLVGDRTRIETTGQKHPVATTARRHECAPEVFGRPVVVVMRHWGNDRMPVECELGRRTDEPPSRAEQRRFRWRLVRVRRPAWAEPVVVVAEAAWACKAHVPLIPPRGSCVVRALARPWGMAKGPTLKALVTYVPPPHARRCWVPLDEPGRRRTSGPLTTRARPRQGGDVPSLVRKQRRTDGPNPPNTLVTQLPDISARQLGASDRRRGSVARLRNEWQGATGWGQPQVTKAPQRVERAGALAVMASLLIVTCRAQDISAQGPWSLFTRTQHVTGQRGQGQIARAVEPRLRRGLQERKAA
jgi:hypothetical protein